MHVVPSGAWAPFFKSINTLTGHKPSTKEQKLTGHEPSTY